MTTYFRPYINSGTTLIYTDCEVIYHIDWVLLAMGHTNPSNVLDDNNYCP